jgi:PAS domain S-box-containing protein
MEFAFALDVMASNPPRRTPEPNRTPPPDVPEGGRLLTAEEAGLYRMLVHSVKDYAIFALDRGGRIISWNAGAERFKGYKEPEILGKHYSVFYPPEDVLAGKPRRLLDIAIREGRVEDEGWRVRKDGTRFWADVVITALHDDSGELVGFAKVTRDLTERRNSEEALRLSAQRIAAAESANRTKAEFLTAMSHELRTPLNAIGGYAELMEMGVAGAVTEQQQEYLMRIRSGQHHLLAIINDLLNYSRIEAGQVAYEFEPVSLKSILMNVHPLVVPQSEKRNVKVIADHCPDTAIALCDRLKTEQIVLNLLSNAVKFTEENGKVTTRCGITANKAWIEVADTGPGIPFDKREAIFEPFVQLGRSLSSIREGTGLGLAISRDLARAMHGDITVGGEPGKGAIFTLYLPKA